MKVNPSHINIGIGIPTYNRYDLLQPNLLLYSRDFELENTPFYIVDNGNQNIDFPYGNIIVNEKNIGVAASWNILCKSIFRTCNYALILNDDIYLGKRIYQIKELIAKKPEVFMRCVLDWCAFVIPKSVYEKVGEFDECFFPAYYEDSSYEYRMKMKAVPMIKTPELNPHQYAKSMSIEKDPSIVDGSKKNRMLYIEMWGGEPQREKYKKPFNN